MKLSSLMILAAVTVFTGCGTAEKNINIDAKPTLQVPKQVKPVTKKKGSLYSRRGASLFSDKKDLQVGDIIQVYVDETLTNDSLDKKETTKDNTTSLGAGTFTPSTSNSTMGKVATKLNRNLSIGFNAGTSNSFTGEAKSTSDEAFTTVVSAVIEETYQNGNYFIKGSKEMLINGQKQNILISGIIRPYDISPENTVYSYQLANLKVYYQKDGVEEALEKPWGSKALETIWPF